MSNIACPKCGSEDLYTRVASLEGSSVRIGAMCAYCDYDGEMDMVHIPSLDEDGAIQVYNDLARKFGWTGSPFTSADVESMEVACYDDNNDEGIVPVTPAMVEAVMGSYTWRKGMPERMAEVGFLMLDDCLTVRPDGTFTVDGETFNANGTQKN